MRDAIRASVSEVKNQPEATNKPRALAQALDVKGVKISVAKSGKDFSFERKSSGTKCRGYKLDRGYSMPGIAKGLGINAARFMVRSMDEGLER